MSQQEMGKAGLWTTVIGALLILIDGIVVLATGNFYGPFHYGGVQATGWIEIIISIIMFGILYYAKKSPAAIGWSEVVLALITLGWDGGFWTIGAWLGVIGGILIAYRK
jgi:hypothetical protein